MLYNKQSSNSVAYKHLFFLLMSLKFDWMALLQTEVGLSQSLMYFTLEPGQNRASQTTLAH